MKRALLTTLGLLVACSVLVEPSDRLRCEPMPGENPCPEGMVCRRVMDSADAYCVEAECGPIEACDGEDNDCDGMVDEGFDNDDDGYNVCGTQDCGDPDVPCVPNDPTKVDCNDADDQIHPGAMEQCNFVDQDCDGSAVPEDLSGLDANCAAGAPGTICEPGRGCIPDDCRAARNPCPEGDICDTTRNPPVCVTAGCDPAECESGGQWCDPTTGECQPRRGAGQSCANDNQCESRVCVESGVLRLPGGSNLCAKACCNDADCASDEFCWDAGNGARSCLPTTVGAGTTGRSTLGTGAAGAACSANAACRSGWCEDGFCVQPCRSDAHCSAGQTCSMFLRDGPDGPRAVLACVTGRRTPPSSCSTSFDCNEQCCTVGRDALFDSVTDVTCDRIRGDSFGVNRAPECVNAEAYCADSTDCGGTRCGYYNVGALAFTGVSHAVIAGRCGSTTADSACCNSRQCGEGNVCRPQLGSGGGETWLMFCEPIRP